jgi:signal peptidase II
MNRLWVTSIFSSALIIIDQLSKGFIEGAFRLGESLPVVSGFFSITYIRNTGAAFGIGANAIPWIRVLLFLFVPVLVCLFLVYLLWTSRHAKDRGLYYFGLGLILTGAIGNLIDRFSLGYVVDFLDFYFQTHHYPAFNVADSCVTVGAVMVGIDAYINRDSEP